MSNEREEGYSDTSDSSNAHDDGTEPCICRHGRPLWGGDLATQANSDNFDSDNPDSNSVIPGGNSVIPAPEPESNNNPIQENKDWIAGQARNDGDVYIPFSEKVGSPAPVIQGERPFSIGALGVGEISTLDDLTPGVTVKYDSQNLSGDSDVIETPVFTSVNTPVVLEVAPVFTDVESNTKTLTITLAEGMAFTSLPGFTRSGSIWDDFSVSKLDSAIREWIVDATYEPATGISAMHPTSAGTVTYTFSAGTVQPGTLALYVAGDSGYVTMLNSALNITDAVTVVRSENGTSATADTVKLETYKVTGSTSQVRFDSNSHVIKNPGDTWEFDTSFYIQTNSTSGNTGDGGSKAHVFDTLIRTFAIPKYLNVNPVVEGSSGVDAGITSTLVSGADNTNYDYLQVTINGKTAKGRNLHFEGQVDDVLPEGIAGTNVIAIASVSSLLTYIQGGSTSQNGFLNPPEIQFTDPNSVGKLTFTPSAVDISANNINAPAVFTPLGTFGFQNLSGADIDNVRLHFDYDSTLVGVRAVRILTTDNSTASNIVITTT
ncbi:MAG: hypothetical protein LBN34_00235, partial [Clostridiales Family XIII bacterium]|nr:hypothetical protein [Clostridiales Family XIII bacterium]